MAILQKVTYVKLFKKHTQHFANVSNRNSYYRPMVHTSYLVPNPIPLTKGNYMSFFNKKKTNIKLLVINYLHRDNVLPVFNEMDATATAA